VVRAVIDTNVLVSALIASSGNEALLLLAVNQGFVKPCFSDPMLKEYAEVLARPRFSFPDDEIAAVLDLFRHHGEHVRATPLTGVSPDPKDDPFMACALESRADFLVTGNKRDFPQERLPGTQVVSAGELLDLVTLTL
jgi:putative PIN family toxin of toxin-antitoxin system